MGVVLGLGVCKETSTLICTLDNVKEDINPSSRHFGSSKLNFQVTNQMSGDVHIFWTFKFLDCENNENPSSREYGTMKPEMSGDIYYIQTS